MLKLIKQIMQALECGVDFIVPDLAQAQRSRIEKYLSQSSDAVDLEMRQRELMRRGII